MTGERATPKAEAYKVYHEEFGLLVHDSSRSFTPQYQEFLAERIRLQALGYRVIPQQSRPRQRISSIERGQHVLCGEIPERVKYLIASFQS